MGVVGSQFAQHSTHIHNVCVAERKRNLLAAELHFDAEAVLGDMARIDAKNSSRYIWAFLRSVLHFRATVRA